MNKILIKLYIPTIGLQYDMWISTKSYVYTIIDLIVRGLKDLTNGEYAPDKLPNLYNKLTGIRYNQDLIIKDTNIVNGTELILI